MKFHAIGVKILSGNSKKSGNAFDMGFVYGLAPVETVKKTDLEISGYGFEPAELPLDPNCLEHFRDIKFPAVIDLDTDVVPRMGKFETVVIGLKNYRAAPAKVA